MLNIINGHTTYGNQTVATCSGMSHAEERILTGFSCSFSIAQRPILHPPQSWRPSCEMIS